MSRSADNRFKRQCCACRRMRPREELIRIALSAQGAVQPDPGGKMPGRGAYLCRSAECIREAARKRALSRSLHCAVPAQVYEELERIVHEKDGDGL